MIERTIRLLKENGITDISISTNNPAFDYLGVEILRHKNNYAHDDSERHNKSEKSWLNAYYPIKKPACYLHADVYFSDEAIKKIVETPVIDTMFFCIRDVSDGRPVGINIKGREPLAYKVQNQIVFRNAINKLFEYIDEGKFKSDPISWNLYRQINGLPLDFNGYGNNIFETKGNYIYIDDYTTDIDFLKDIPKLEKLLLIMKGGIKMVRAKVIENFSLGKFNELRNIKRANPNLNANGQLYVKDEFECTEEMFKYLTENNKMKRAFVKLIEVIPEKPKTEIKTEVKEEIKEESKEEAPLVRRRRTRKSVAKN